jgi:RHS repeat-associated protein
MDIDRIIRNFPNPLAEKYYSTSPYAYCLNNPVNRVYPAGTDRVEDGNKNVSRGSVEYQWNKNGAMTKDLNNGVSDIQYNHLNLPTQIDIKSPVAEARQKYTYSATGEKLNFSRQWNSNHSTNPIIGSAVNTASLNQWDEVVYVNNKEYYGYPSEYYYLTKIHFDGGYYSSDDGMNFFYIKDHQGNIRVVADEYGYVVQRTDYDPFGMIMPGSSNRALQPYKYNGKEFVYQDGLNLYDYGARRYDPARTQFTTIDPMAEKYPWISPYAYCNNNPVNLVDPTGMSPKDEKEDKTVLEQFMESIRRLFSINIDVTSTQTMRQSAEQLESNAATIRQATEVVNMYSDAFETMNPVGSTTKTVLKLSYGEELSGEDIAYAGLELLPIVGGEIGTTAKVSKTAAKGERLISIWPAASRGKTIINGIEYTIHALERMQPVGTIMDGTKLFSRGIPPSVVENAIKYGTVTQGKTTAEVVRTFENVRVITNPAGTKVITVYKLGR